NASTVNGKAILRVFPVKPSKKGATLSSSIIHEILPPLRSSQPLLYITLVILHNDLTIGESINFSIYIPLSANTFCSYSLIAPYQFKPGSTSFLRQNSSQIAPNK